MVEVAVKIQTHGEKLKARLGRVRVPGRRPGIRVEPANEDLRRVMKHPSGIRFRSEGSVEWPDDQFTRRRIKAGDVKVAGAKQAEEKTEDQPKLHQSRKHERE